MEPELCSVCGKPMAFNSRGNVGDPSYVCPTDDSAHRDERRRIREAARAILSAPKPDAPDPAVVAELGAEANPAWRDPK